MTTTPGVDAEVLFNLTIRAAMFGFMAGVLLAESMQYAFTRPDEEWWSAAFLDDVLFDAVLFTAANTFFAFLMFECLAVST